MRPCLRSLSARRATGAKAGSGSTARLAPSGGPGASRMKHAPAPANVRNATQRNATQHNATQRACVVFKICVRAIDNFLCPVSVVSARTVTSSWLLLPKPPGSTEHPRNAGGVRCRSGRHAPPRSICRYAAYFLRAFFFIFKSACFVIGDLCTPFLRAPLLL